MIIKHIRYSHGIDDTLGMWLIDGSFACYTLEDEHRDVKVYAETRIPEGVYEIKLRKHGGFHQRYLKKFGGDFHKGMLQVVGVPNFSDILIHIGNTDEDTAGCILIGEQSVQNVTGKGYIGNSTSAYKRIYPRIAKALLKGQRVIIEIKSI